MTRQPASAPASIRLATDFSNERWCDVCGYYKPGNKSSTGAVMSDSFSTVTSPAFDPAMSPPSPGSDPPEPILKYFTYAHLPHALQVVSTPFANLAHSIAKLPRCAERAVALRKLLEAKDAAVRAALSDVADPVVEQVGQEKAAFIEAWAVEWSEWMAIRAELAARALDGESPTTADVTDEQRKRMAARGEKSVLDSDLFKKLFPHLRPFTCEARR